jgi:hypothetical protein
MAPAARFMLPHRCLRRHYRQQNGARLVDRQSRKLHADTSAGQEHWLFLFRQRGAHHLPVVDWRKAVSNASRWTTGFTSSPGAATDRLYITNEDGHTFLLAKGSEYKLLGENDIGETVMASAAISGNLLYVRGRNHLFAIGGR